MTLNNKNWLFRLGAHFRTLNANIGTEQNLRVAAIISHPSYNKPIRLSNDIALLKLAQPARLGKGIGLVCLGSEEYDVPLSSNSKCFITGWGTLASGGNQPNALMQASVPLVSKQRCLAAYPQKIDDSMLCAGLDQGGVDACQGDSGGPLVCEHRPHRWFLEGATSWGWGCAVPGKFGVYARVRHFRNWLMEKMNLSPTEPGRLPDRIKWPCCNNSFKKKQYLLWSTENWDFLIKYAIQKYWWFFTKVLFLKKVCIE